MDTFLFFFFLTFVYYNVAHCARLPDISEPAIAFGAFNVQNYGSSKSQKQEILDILIKVIAKYDIMAFIEIVDVKEKAFDVLINRLNQQAKKSDQYSYVISERLGRTFSKEQYAFIYKPAKIKILDTYQYPENLNHFERPPYAVKVKLVNASLDEAVFMTIHTRPEDALIEMKNLHTAYLSVKNHWKIDDIVIMGDFNSDCKFVSPMDLRELNISQSNEFTWLITRCAGTTMLRTHCIYDHIVIAGQKLRLAIPPASAEVFRFDEAYNLNQSFAFAVSDHYPIRALINGKVNNALVSKMSASWSFTIEQPLPDDRLTKLREIYRAADYDKEDRAGYDIMLLKLGFAIYRVEAVTRHVTDVIASLKSFQKAFPDVLEERSLALVNEHLKTNFFNNIPQVPGYSHRNDTREINIQVNCKLQSPVSCSIQVSSTTRQN